MEKEEKVSPVEPMLMAGGVVMFLQPNLKCMRQAATATTRQLFAEAVTETSIDRPRVPIGHVGNVVSHVQEVPCIMFVFSRSFVRSLVRPFAERC